ncbi:MAG: carbon starvation CstA 5TM domain-containing protein, partial [Phycisphaerae bacterium]
NRFVATAIAVAAICFFAFYKMTDQATGTVKPAGLALWTLFGITNQLLAGLTLLVVTLYLHQRGRNPLFTGLPALFMLISTFTAIVEKLTGFYRNQQYLLLVVGGALLLIGVGIVLESALAVRRRNRYATDTISFDLP